MTMQQEIDNRAILAPDAAALRVREALLALLRSWEDMHGLPRSVPTWAERNPGSGRGGKHTKRDSQ